MGKRVDVPILFMSNGCVLGVMCNKPIRVSFPIPFKSQLHLLLGGKTECEKKNQKTGIQNPKFRQISKLN